MTARLFALLAALAIFSQPLHAGFGAVGTDTGATLLLPYFEVDLDDQNSDNTVFRVANTAPLPVIAHVTLWTDWAVASLGFEVYLEGNGALDINLREVFRGRNPSPVPLVLFTAGTSGGLPSGQCSPGFLGLAAVSHIVKAHTGQPSSVFSNRCAGNDFGDRRVRGFVTIDVLEACTDFLPDNSSYFLRGGQASSENVLWGTFALINRGESTSAGEKLVKLEADTALGGFSFYSNLADTGGADFREPLPSGWGAPFFNSDGRTTDVILWRDPGEPTNPQPCSSTPGWFPLEFGEFVLRNPAGSSFDVSAFAPFPLATNRVRIGADALPSPYDSGWIRADLAALTELGATPNGIFIPFAPQAYMFVLHNLGPGEASAQAGTVIPVFIPF